MSIDDLSPSLSIPNENNELYVDEDFKETPLQNVGGLQVGSRELTHGKIRIAGIEERIYFGKATDFSTGNGIIMGKRTEGDTDYYDFRFGNPDGNYIRWNEQTGNLSIVGTITAGTGSEVDWSYIENVAVKNIDIAETLTVSNTEADITQDELDAGAIIDNAKANGFTLIEGGYINTDVLEIDYSLIIGSKPPVDADVTAENTAKDIVNLPDTPDTAGLYASGTHLGYHDGTSWQVYFEDNGDFHFDGDGSNYIEWNGVTLDIRGALTADDIQSGGTISGVDIVSNNTSGDKIELSSGDELNFYASKSLRARLRGTTSGSGGLFVEDNSDVYVENDQSFFIQDSAGTDDGYGGIGIDSSDQLLLTMGTDNTFFLRNNDETVRFSVNGDVPRTVFSAPGSTDKHFVRPSGSELANLGTSTYDYHQLFVNLLRYKDIDTYQTHDDIQMMKDIGTTEVDEYGTQEDNEEDRAMASQQQKQKRKVWDKETLPEGTVDKGFVNGNALSGFLIGTMKQVIDRIEKIEDRIDEK